MEMCSKPIAELLNETLGGGGGGGVGGGGGGGGKNPSYFA